jgi:hypothetical protein
MIDYIRSFQFSTVNKSLQISVMEGMRKEHPEYAYKTNTLFSDARPKDL